MALRGMGPGKDQAEARISQLGQDSASEREIGPIVLSVAATSWD